MKLTSMTRVVCGAIALLWSGCAGNVMTPAGNGAGGGAGETTVSGSGGAPGAGGGTTSSSGGGTGSSAGGATGTGGGGPTGSGGTTSGSGGTSAGTGGARGTGGVTGAGGATGGGVGGSTGGPCVESTCGSHKWPCWRMPNPVADGAGVPNHQSYTDLGNGAVKDNVTCLVWEKANPATQGTWQASADRCAALATSNYAGFNDWRMPTRVEMASITDVNNGAKGFASIFTVTAGYYGTSSWWYETITGQNTSGFQFGYGTNGFTSNAVAMSGTNNVARCVRGNGPGEAADAFAKEPPNHYTIAAGEVTDNYTGLIWQQAYSPALHGLGRRARLLHRPEPERPHRLARADAQRAGVDGQRSAGRPRDQPHRVPQHASSAGRPPGSGRWKRRRSAASPGASTTATASPAGTPPRRPGTPSPTPTRAACASAARREETPGRQDARVRISTVRRWRAGRGRAPAARHRPDPGRRGQSAATSGGMTA